MNSSPAEILLGLGVGGVIALFAGYVCHLHWQSPRAPSPKETDTPSIQSLFDYLQLLQAMPAVDRSMELAHRRVLGVLQAGSHTLTDYLNRWAATPAAPVPALVELARHHIQSGGPVLPALEAICRRLARTMEAERQISRQLSSITIQRQLGVLAPLAIGAVLAASHWPTIRPLLATSGLWLVIVVAALMQLALAAGERRLRGYLLNPPSLQASAQLVDQLVLASQRLRCGLPPLQVHSLLREHSTALPAVVGELMRLATSEGCVIHDALDRQGVIIEQKRELSHTRLIQRWQVIWLAIVTAVQLPLILLLISTPLWPLLQ
jgi:hypothetical protein